MTLQPLLLLFFQIVYLLQNQSYKEMERDTEQKRERESFHLLVHIPDGQNAQGWAKPGSQVLHPGLSRREESHALGLSFTVFMCQQEEAGWKTAALDMNNFLYVM